MSGRELDRSARPPAVDACRPRNRFRRARAKYVSVLCPFPDEAEIADRGDLKKSPQMRKARSRTRTDDPFLTMEVLYRTELSGRWALGPVSL
jgi:hypothetical protein